jgi:rubredoxin
MRRLIPRWRKATWAIFLFSLLMLIWVIAAGSASADCSEEEEFRGACKAGEAVGRGIGVTLVIILWVLGFIVLSLIWLMSRPKHRVCPRCGHDVKKGWTQCRNCGYDFAAATGDSQQVTAG